MRSAFRRTLMGLALTTALCSPFVGGNAAADPADESTARGGCGEVRNPSINGARAHWELSCKDGKIHVSGWVEDTDANGRCAKVKAIFASGNTEFSDAACPKGRKVHFSWAHPGSIASVYLFEYDT